MHSYSGNVSSFILSFLSLFSVINPIKFVIVFLSMTYYCSKTTRTKLANKAMIVGLFILLVSMMLGGYIFKFLGIEMYSFKMAGGLLLAISGINMLLGADVELPTNAQLEEINSDIAVFPLAIPLITGPGAISTSIVLLNDAHSMALKSGVVIAAFANFIIMYLLLNISYTFATRLNKLVLSVLLRACGLLLSALAVNIFISGLKDSGLLG